MQLMFLRITFIPKWDLNNFENYDLFIIDPCIFHVDIMKLIISYFILTVKKNSDKFLGGRGDGFFFA